MFGITNGSTYCRQPLLDDSGPGMDISDHHLGIFLFQSNHEWIYRHADKLLVHVFSSQRSEIKIQC